VVFAGVVFGVFDQKPLLRLKLVKWFLSSKVVFAINYSPRTFCDHLRTKGICLSFLSIAFIKYVGVETNNLQFTEHQFVAAAFKQDDSSSSDDDL
jgi:hypothetical protein